MKICYAVSEVVPYSKTGGLGDVAGALPHALARLGHDVRIFAPLHVLPGRPAPNALAPVAAVQDVELALGGRPYVFSLRTDEGAGRGGAPVLLVDCPALFRRAQLYTSEPDEPLRFALLCRAVFESCQRLAWAPDVIHCNDWHTALIPLLRDTVYGWDALFRPTRTLLTIHNLGYQGLFPASTIERLGLAGWSASFDARDREAGRLNLLRTGVRHADAVSTVSPTYAREILGPELGMGLDADLRARPDGVAGILNGVDYAIWSPESDPHLPARYSAANLAGKRANKRALLELAGLDPDPGPPLAGIITRLVEQKGLDLCVAVLPELLETTDLRLVVLGQGQARYEQFFDLLANRKPRRVAFRRGQDETLAHRIEAGADLFLMPSRYEPCGLNQMFSLRYGTIPVVRRTGGLADSVRPYDRASDAGTGFVFDHFTPEGLRWALGLADETFSAGPRWRRLVLRAMAEDFSWARQARRYVELYERIERRRG
jgi:starch synthase